MTDTPPPTNTNPTPQPPPPPPPPSPDSPPSAPATQPSATPPAPAAPPTPPPTAPAPPPPPPPTAPPSGSTTYDPADYTVDEVRKYAAEHPEQAGAILAAERAGKNRTTLVSALEAQLAPAPPPSETRDANGDPVPPPTNPLAPADGSAAGGPPVVTDPSRVDPTNPPAGYVENRAATAQPTGDPAHDAPPYSQNAYPPEVRSDYASAETSSDQETTIKDGDPNASASDGG